MIFHVGHGGTTKDQHQFRCILVLVDQQLQRGRKALGGTRHVGVLVNGQDDTLFFGHLEHILQGSLKGRKRSAYRYAGVALNNSLAEVFEILLGVTFDANEINRLLIADKLVDQSCFAHSATAINNGKLKLIRRIEPV